MKKLALFVFVLLVGCAQQPSRIPSTPHELSIVLQTTQTTVDDTAPARPLPEVPPLAMISRVPDSVPADTVPNDSARSTGGLSNSAAPSVASSVSDSSAADEKPPAATDAPPTSLWPRLIAGFRMEPMDGELVHQWEQWYSDRPEYVGRMIERSTRFLFFVVEQVEKRHMPSEVALLPMIESAYNPTAYSRAHASGMWQFVAATCRDYGLRQSWWYDARRDVIEATEAALDYLEKLHGLFGDWELALAAYNCGEGTVSRAIERNQAKGLPTDYESLSLPAETRSYVPKLIAVKNIVSDPARYGLQIEDIENEQYFDSVTLNEHIDVKLAADLAEIPLDEFMMLNPGHRKPVIKAGEAEQIVLPKDAVEVFRRNLKRHRKPLVTWKAIRLRRGETVKRVADAVGMTLAELRSVNGLLAQRRLAAGQPLLVRVTTGQAGVLSQVSEPVSLPDAIRRAKARAETRSGHGKHTREERHVPSTKAQRSARPQPRLSRRGAPVTAHVRLKRAPSARR